MANEVPLIIKNSDANSGEYIATKIGLLLKTNMANFLCVFWCGTFIYIASNSLSKTVTEGEAILSYRATMNAKKWGMMATYL